MAKEMASPNDPIMIMQVTGLGYDVELLNPKALHCVPMRVLMERRACKTMGSCRAWRTGGDCCCGIVA
uniref:Uncharacterized protein n=1 Tax=Arundo donax TaxID=35708 RepID=A0A0A9H5W8_ARUDO